MARLIHERDWSASPLGPVSAWPQALRFALDLVLGCGFPATLQWGPELRLFYNDAYIPLIAARHPHALGRPILETFPEIADSYGPMADRVRNGETVILQDQLFHYLRYDLPEDSWFDLSYSPVRDEAGKVAGIFAVGLETTSRILAERARTRSDAFLRQSEERMRRVLETDAVGVIFFDYTGTVVDANDVFLRMTGYTRQQLGARELTWRTMTPDEYVEVSEEQMDNLARTGRIGPYEKEYILNNGSRRWMLFAGRDLGDGTISEYCVDITDRKAAEQALRESERLAIVGRLASSIAHEINNPLEAVTNLLYLAQQDSTSPETRQYLADAQSELSRVSQIATETLRFNRRNSQATPTNLSELLDSVLSLHEGRVRGSNIRVERRFTPHDPPLVFANEIRQVVANLIGNAVDAMLSAGQRRLIVRVRPSRHARTQTPGVRITVADTGGGIEPAMIARLYEPFFTTKQTTGNGLGLWVSHEIVRKHSGDLRVRSRTTHPSGTVFTVFLPAVPVVALQPSTSAASA